MDIAETGADSDAALIARASAGDADAFRILVERHARAVFRLTFRMTANTHDAEDLVQETFLRAARQINRFDGRASFSTWLFRIASNCSVDFLRARRVRTRRHVLPTPVDSGGTAREPWETLPADTPSPETLSMAGEIQRHLVPAMQRLSRQERAAFLLRHYEGASIAEISGALGIRPNAAKHSIFRAVAKLRRALAPTFRAGSPAGTDPSRNLEDLRS